MPDVNVNLEIEGLMQFKGDYSITGGVLPSGGAVKKGWMYRLTLSPPYTPVTIDGVELYNNSIVVSMDDNPTNTFSSGWLRLV